jgi:hypothetical protein
MDDKVSFAQKEQENQGFAALAAAKAWLVG